MLHCFFGTINNNMHHNPLPVNGIFLLNANSSKYEQKLLSMLMQSNINYYWGAIPQIDHHPNHILFIQVFNNYTLGYWIIIVYHIIIHKLSDNYSIIIQYYTYIIAIIILAPDCTWTGWNSAGSCCWTWWNLVVLMLS